MIKLLVISFVFAVSFCSGNEAPDVWNIIHKLEARLSKVENRQDKAEEMTEKRFSKTEDKIQEITERQVPVVAFAASNSESQSRAAGEKLLFDVVELNSGSGYDAQTGVFTCPYNGYYLISASITANGGVFCAYDMIKEDQPIARQMADSASSKHASSSSPLAVYCMTGERVWLETRYNSCRYINAFNQGHSHFTGILVSQD